MQYRRCLVGLILLTAFGMMIWGLILLRRSGRQMPGRNYKYILQWNSYFNIKNLGQGNSNVNVFEKLGCPYSECIYTEDRSLKPVEDFDAVIVHMYRFKLKAPPDPNIDRLPRKRSPHQRYIFFLMEAPPITQGSYEYTGGLFNWTMTYRLDSDIVRLYGRLLPLGDTPAPAQGWLPAPAVPIAPSAAALVAHNSTDMSGKGEKKALVAWLVSHCPTPSRREDYVRALSEHIGVDVYGKCGTRPWSKNDTGSFYHMLSANYTFYLSFENSLCRDYVTEKLFNVLPLDIVPVVYGGANYSAFAPPHSYIDARDFASPRDLARYLHFLAQHPEELRKFWWWKRHYRVEHYPSSTLCSLCERLHNPGPAGAYEDVARWYGGPGTCQEPHLV